MPDGHVQKRVKMERRPVIPDASPRKKISIEKRFLFFRHLLFDAKLKSRPTLATVLRRL